MFSDWVAFLTLGRGAQRCCLFSHHFFLHFILSVPKMLVITWGYKLLSCHPHCIFCLWTHSVDVVSSVPSFCITESFSRVWLQRPLPKNHLDEFKCLWQNQLLWMIKTLKKIVIRGYLLNDYTHTHREIHNIYSCFPVHWHTYHILLFSSISLT